MLCLPTSDVVARCLEAIKLHGGDCDHRLHHRRAGGHGGDGREAGEVRVDYLDATVLGSSRVVRGGTAVVMAGGRRRCSTRRSPLFKTFASRAFYLGSYGAGARMKLVANLALGLHRAVLAETLAFAHACEVSPVGRARGAEGGRGLFARDGR